MPTRIAILGIDPVQQPWLDALSTLAAGGEIELIGVAHRSQAAAKETGSLLPGTPVFDDLRNLLNEGGPQAIIMDRPTNVSVEFLLACAQAGVAIFSLGPPVVSLAEAQTLAQVLPARTHLLQMWPRFADCPAAKQSAAADGFVRPIRFASATWMGVNHALAKTAASTAGEFALRSMSVLAWDCLATLIQLMDMPISVQAAIRGTVPSGPGFADLSGAAALTLRFANEAVASVTLCDRLPAGGKEWSRRSLWLWGNGTLKLEENGYEFRDAEGKVIDESGTPADAADATPAATRAQEALREFLRHLALPPSPHRGWEHRLEETAAAMEALVVSHRTGQAESPEKFRLLRR